MERKISQSVDLLKSTFENKINELTESNRRLKRRIFDLYTIFDISRKLNSSLDPNALLEEMLLTLIGQLEIKGAAIFIQKDPNQKELSMFKIRGVNLERHPDFTEFKFRQDGDLLKLLLSEEGPLFLDEIRAHIKKGSPDSVMMSSRGDSSRRLPFRVNLQGEPVWADPKGAKSKDDRPRTETERKKDAQKDNHLCG